MTGGVFPKTVWIQFQRNATIAASEPASHAAAPEAQSLSPLQLSANTGPAIVSVAATAAPEAKATTRPIVGPTAGLIEGFCGPKEAGPATMRR